MQRNFGKYKSRLKQMATKPAAKSSQGGSVSAGGSLRTGGSVSGGSVNAGGSVSGGSVNAGGSLRTGGSVGDVFDSVVGVVDKAARGVAAVGKIIEAGQKSADRAKEQRQGGSLLELNRVKPHLPFSFFDHRHAADVITSMTDHEYHSLQSGAAHLADIHDHAFHAPILHHRPLITAPMHKFHKIVKTPREGLIKAMQHDPHLRDAISNSMQAAHHHGATPLHAVHYAHIPEKPRQGGGLTDMIDTIGKLANPIDELGRGVRSYNKVDLEHTFDNPQMFARNAVHGYAGNMHMWSAYGKASVFAPVVGQVLAPSIEPVAIAEGEAANELDKIAEEI